jgi:histone H3/H4
VSEVLVVTSKVKDLVKSLDPEMRTGGDFIEELSRAVQEFTKTAVSRAKVAGRKTVKADDL